MVTKLFFSHVGATSGIFILENKMDDKMNEIIQYQYK